MVDEGFYGWARRRIRLRNGSQIGSWQFAAGTKLPAISSVIWMGPVVRSSSEDLDQWAFVIGRQSPCSPWQNGYAERLIGSIRRECVDYIIVVGERHLRQMLLSYMTYYNEARTHLSLNKDAPVQRAVERAGHILCRPVLGGLHHQYVRI
jgi:transposase InsO family protein